MTRNVSLESYLDIFRFALAYADSLSRHFHKFRIVGACEFFRARLPVCLYEPIEPEALGSLNSINMLPWNGDLDFSVHRDFHCIG